MRARLLAAAAAASVTALTAAGLTLPLAPPAAAVTAPFQDDFNGDHYADIAVGVPSATVDGKKAAGYVDIVWGGPNGPGAHGNTRISQASTGVPGTVEAGDRFGSAVEAADLDGDGYADLAVGISGESLTTSTTADHGMVTVLHGSAKGIAPGGATVAKGVTEFSEVGGALTSGDFDGDGAMDLALGVSEEENSSLHLRRGPLTADAGTTTVRMRTYSMSSRIGALQGGDFDGDGRDDLAVTWRALEDSATDIHRFGADGSMSTFWSSPDSGTSLAVADFDQDGTDDLAVGGVTPNPETDYTHCTERLGGAVLALYGGKPGAGQFGASYDCFSQASEYMAGTPEEGDGFGDALAAGDLDGDAYPELVVGVPREDVGSAKDAGMYVVMNGTTTGPFGGMGVHQGTPNIPGTVEAGDLFGAELNSSYYNAGSLADTAIGAPGENAGTGGVWYVATAETGHSPGRSLTPRSLGLPGAAAFGSVLGR
ncbi:FG-GAP and VCBS repeat-containing protein [Streptomyces sp. NPDC050418]|uniref:FG-GAP and VCBS repeat-containing protein n=1 Tax=Streptomyces sp. NPDC050418 TaxID=3365612 RepID=UPI003798D526